MHSINISSQTATLLILACVVSFFLGYAMMPDDFQLSFELKKIGLQYSQSSAPATGEGTTTEETTVEETTDTTLIAQGIADSNSQLSTPDSHLSSSNYTARQRILFIGDSMLEGLSLRLNDYAATDNNYLMTVIWYASGTRHWGGTDSLSMLIKKYQPTYIFISLGGNELQARNVERLKPYIHNIVNTCGDIPFVWIGPPNWKPDTGINDAIREIVGDNRFFDSSELQLARKSDHIHPTYTAAADWMDSIATWVSSPQTAVPIRMTYPNIKATKRNLRVFKRAR